MVKMGVKDADEMSSGEIKKKSLVYIPGQGTQT